MYYLTILFIAMYGSAGPIAMQVLLDNGANVNIQDDIGYTALSVAGKNWISTIKQFVSMIYFTNRK